MIGLDIDNSTDTIVTLLLFNLGITGAIPSQVTSTVRDHDDGHDHRLWQLPYIYHRSLLHHEFLALLEVLVLT